MTKREAERWANVVRVLSGEGYGISRDDIEALRRIEMTLRRWSERECNGEVEVDVDTGKANAVHVSNVPGTDHQRWPIPNREAGALRRLSAIMARYPHLRAYHQTDPRGCALYVYKADALLSFWSRGCYDKPADIDSCYSSVGVAVCR